MRDASFVCKLRSGHDARIADYNGHKCLSRRNALFRKALQTPVVLVCDHFADWWLLATTGVSASVTSSDRLSDLVTGPRGEATLRSLSTAMCVVISHPALLVISVNSDLFRLKPFKQRRVAQTNFWSLDLIKPDVGSDTPHLVEVCLRDVPTWFDQEELAVGL